MNKYRIIKRCRLIISLIVLVLLLCSCDAMALSPASTSDRTATAVAQPAKIEVKTNRAEIDFPGKLIFYFDATSVSPITSVSLEYSTNKRAITAEILKAEPDFTPGEHIGTSWTMDMKKSASVPPGAVITWQWKTVDKSGSAYATPSKTMRFTDTRFDWKLKSSEMMDIYWCSQSESTMNTMMSGLENRLATIKLPFDFPPERKPTIFLYANSTEIKQAIMSSNEWMGAVAYYDYNVILIPCSLDMLSWCHGAMAHEMTHLIVRQNVFGPFGDLPTWLNEGLARYSEGGTSEGDLEYLSTAIGGKKTISIRSLGGSFPNESDAAGLAYAESGSIVRYMITTGGWKKMQQLLEVFKEGSTTDGALMKVYGYNSATLEKQWLEWFKTQK